MDFRRGGLESPEIFQKIKKENGLTHYLKWKEKQKERVIEQR